MINFTKKVILRYFSRILFKSFRGVILQNTSWYICSKQVMHGPFKIIQIYVNNKINILKAFSFLTMCFYRLCSRPGNQYQKQSLY